MDVVGNNNPHKKLTLFAKRRTTRRGGAEYELKWTVPRNIRT